MVVADGLKDYLLVVFGASGTFPDDSSRWMRWERPPGIRVDLLVTGRLDSSCTGVNRLFCRPGLLSWCVWFWMWNLHQDKAEGETMSDRYIRVRMSLLIIRGSLSSGGRCWASLCVNDEQKSSSVLDCLKPATCSTTWQLEEQWCCGCCFCPCSTTAWSLCCSAQWIWTKWFEQFVDSAVLGQSISASHVGHFVCILATLARKPPQRPHKHQDWNTECWKKGVGWITFTLASWKAYVCVV